MPRASASPPSPAFLQGTRWPPLECSSWLRLGPGERQGPGSAPSGTERCRAPLPPSQNASLPFSGYFCVCLEHRGHGCPRVGSSVNSLLSNPKGKARSQPPGHLSYTSRPLCCLKGELPTRPRGRISPLTRSCLLCPVCDFSRSCEALLFMDSKTFFPVTSVFWLPQCLQTRKRSTCRFGHAYEVYTGLTEG